MKLRKAFKTSQCIPNYEALSFQRNAPPKFAYKSCTSVLNPPYFNNSMAFDNQPFARKKIVGFHVKAKNHQRKVNIATLKPKSLC